MRITCRFCKEESDVAPHFSNPHIIKEDNPQPLIPIYLAIADALVVCPACGVVLRETYKTEITPKDIINLALRREIL